MNGLNNSKPTRLSKVITSETIFSPTINNSDPQVYFTWVIRDFGAAEWFHSLLHAIEEQDIGNRIEINIYLTARMKEDEMSNIIVQDVGAEKDAITSLRAPTHFGRPNWDRVFGSIIEKHPATDVGVVCVFDHKKNHSNIDFIDFFAHSFLVNSFSVALLPYPGLYTICQTNGLIQRVLGSSSVKVCLGRVENSMTTKLKTLFP
jgi:hypothetical protein